MPSTLPRPCNALGCHRTTTSGRFCAEHRKAYERNRVRPNAAQRGYDSTWRQARQAAIQAQPFCSVCGSTERLEVDHVVPLSRGGTHDPGNLRVLCGTCHRRKTARQR